MAYKRTVSSMADTAKLPTNIESCKLEINSDDQELGTEFMSLSQILIAWYDDWISC